jgi:hypothetical protein
MAVPAVARTASKGGTHTRRPGGVTRARTHHHPGSAQDGLNPLDAAHDQHDMDFVPWFFAAALFAYLACRVIRGGSERPQSQKPNGFVVIGFVALLFAIGSLLWSLLGFGFLAAQLGYLAYRCIRGGFERPQSEKLNGFGVFGCFLLLAAAASVLCSLVG